MNPTYIQPEKEKIFENRLDFFLFFTIYYYTILNNDKLWQVQEELKL